MLDEISVLQNSETWKLIPLPSRKSIVSCRWVFTIKVGLDGTIDHLKARLAAKGYTQIFCLNYGSTFSPVAKNGSCSLIHSYENSSKMTSLSIGCQKCFS